MRVQAREDLRAQRREDDRVRRLRRLSGSVRLTVTCVGTIGEVVHEFRLLTSPPEGVHNQSGHVVVELGETVLHSVSRPGMGARECYLAPHFALRMVQDMLRRGYAAEQIDGLVYPKNL